MSSNLACVLFHCFWLGLCSRLEHIRLTGIGPTSLSFLPDDQMRPGMDTETVALLPVLRKIEVLTNVDVPFNCLSGKKIIRLQTV